MTKKKVEELRKKLESMIRKELAGIEIDRVDVREDVDHDGDEILRVLVVFGGSQDDLDGRRTLHAITRVHETLLDEGEVRFPIFSYVSRADAKGLKPAAE